MNRTKFYVFVMSVMLASGMGVLNAQGQGAKPLTEDQKKIQAIQRELEGLDKEQEAIETKTTELATTGGTLTFRIDLGVRAFGIWEGLNEDLKRQQVALNQEMQRSETTGTGLREGMAQLDRETQALTQAANENAARQERLSVNRVQFRARTLTLLEDLKKRESMSAECKKPGLSLETAHRCLQQVWDGAR